MVLVVILGSSGMAHVGGMCCWGVMSKLSAAAARVLRLSTFFSALSWNEGGGGRRLLRIGRMATAALSWALLSKYYVESEKRLDPKPYRRQ